MRPVVSGQFCARMMFLSACVFGAGCVIAAEAELADLEIVNSGIAIPAAPPEADGSEVTLAVSYRQKPERAGVASAAFQEVRVMGVSMVATAGIGDLTFLRALRIMATSPEAEAAGRAPLPIAEYNHTSGQNVGSVLEISNTPAIDVTTLWKGKEIIFILEVTGQLPSVPWTADVGLRVGATLSY